MLEECGGREEGALPQRISDRAKDLPPRLALLCAKAALPIHARYVRVDDGRSSPSRTALRPRCRRVLELLDPASWRLRGRRTNPLAREGAWG